jgi:dsRNA-specific ribonuclease
MSVFTQKDKTVYASTYFPERNGIKPDVKLGRNYDNDTLFYMSKVKVAQYIADKIETFTFNKPYFLVEICSGIGGNTLEFLSRQKCATAITFERDKKRSLYLKRNIIAYKLDDKAIVIDDEITGNEDFSNFKDSIFYFDPPWLPEDYKDADADYKKHYIRKGIKIGNLTLEKWLEKLRDTAYMVAFRVGPVDYDLGEVPGWTYHFENLGRDESRRAQAEDGKLYFCFNNSKIKGASMDKFGGYIKSVPMMKSKLLPPSTEIAESYINYRSVCAKDPVGKAKDENCPFLRYKFTDPEPEKKIAPVDEVIEKSVKGPKFGKVPLSEQVWKFTDIPSPSKKIKIGSPEWLSEFQNYLAVVLRKFIPNTDIVNQLLAGDNISIWLKAFTDDTFKPDPTENYESMETLGDAILKFAFTEYLYEVLGSEAKQHSITAYTQDYASETFQVYLGKSFNFGEWLIHSDLFEPSEKINEDLVESFIGALYLTGNQVSVKTLLGMRLVQKFVKFYSEKLVFKDDTEEKLGNDKMNIEQRFQTVLGRTVAIIKEEQYGAMPKIQIQLIIKQDIINEIAEKGVIIRSPIGIGFGSTLSKAKAEAYTNARKNLDAMGLTDTFVNEFKYSKFIKQLEIKDNSLYKLFKTVLTNMEIDVKKDIEFQKKTTPESKSVFSTINDIRGNKIIKLSEGVGQNEYEASVNAIKKFIEDN